MGISNRHNEENLLEREEIEANGAYTSPKDNASWSR